VFWCFVVVVVVVICVGMLCSLMSRCIHGFAVVSLLIVYECCVCVCVRPYDAYVFVRFVFHL